MSRFLFLLCFALLNDAALAEPVTLAAADGVKVFGEWWKADRARAPIILAFHQAGSNNAEYETIAKRLNQAGFSVLAIDQRSGGREFNGTNKTVAALGRSTAYDAALKDLEAALAWGKANAQGARVIVWGSSYSAALVFLLAARHPDDVSGLLAFSPGEYLDRSNAVHSAARKIVVPVFIDQASDKDEIDQSRSILKDVKSSDKRQFTPQKGVHGSATLRADRNPKGAEENWDAVLAFLGQFNGR